MRKKWKGVLLAGWGLVATVVFGAVQAAEVTRLVLKVPQSFLVAYTGQSGENFPNGFVPAFGSGIALKAANPDGSLEFYLLTDRGPNVEGPKYVDDQGERDGVIFPVPNFQPQIAVAVLRNGSAEVTETVGLQAPDGSAITGLPVAPGLPGATGEVPLAEDLRVLSYDDNGLDPEGVAVDAEGNFWVCDEYGPFIAKFDREGRLLKKYGPGEGLPEVLRYRIPNRGFEGITVTPEGRVYAALQSVLDVEGKTAKTAQFTRIVELDPRTGKTRMYAYPIDVESYKSPKDAKVGDIFAISEQKLLLIEQGKGKDGKMRNIVYLVDLAGCTDLSDVRISGQEPEHIADRNRLSQEIRFARKELVVDLRALGWDMEKAEGIALLPDRKTIVVVNDNDFGVSLAPNAGVTFADYTLDALGNLRYCGTKPLFHLVPQSEETELWFIPVSILLKE